MRRDRASGVTVLGWEYDLPTVRFEHLEFILECEQCVLPAPGNDHFAVYQNAVERVAQANRRMLVWKLRSNHAKGWYRIPFRLATRAAFLEPHANPGNAAAAAMQLLYLLTHNCKQAWVVIRQNKPVHVRARYPLRQLDSLTYQVWYQKQLQELRDWRGEILEGSLRICESGLWFDATHEPPTDEHRYVEWRLVMHDYLDTLPDIRDGLTRLERIILYCLHEAQKERGGGSVPSALLYGRVVEMMDVGKPEFEMILAKLVSDKRI